MPLDDIFYKETNLTKAKQLERHLQIVGYITGFLAWISINVSIHLEQGIEFAALIMSICLIYQLPLVVMGISYILSKLFGFIPYHDFPKKERVDIYYYMFINLIYVIIILMCVAIIFIFGGLGGYLYELEN